MLGGFDMCSLSRSLVDLDSSHWNGWELGAVFFGVLGDDAPRDVALEEVESDGSAEGDYRDAEHSDQNRTYLHLSPRMRWFFRTGELKGTGTYYGIEF